MGKIQESALGEYLYKQHGLILLGSEIDDILALARQEIELPQEEEVHDYLWDKREDYKEDTIWAFREGYEWTVAKVRNPYPKPM